MTVKVHLESSLNVSFDHMVDTGIELEEWAAMTAKDQDEIVEEAVWASIDASVVEEDD